jgi:ABC-2 type transport system ATP-binding protein
LCLKIARVAACGKLHVAIIKTAVFRFRSKDPFVIEINDVTKKFYDFTALNHVTLRISRGEVVGLVGPNGAGKTTLFKLIVGILQPTSGQIRPTVGAWPAIGYKPERLLFPNELRVRQYLERVAQISNVPHHTISRVVDESLARVDLTANANKRIKDCSKGMRQRLGLAQILIGDPPLVLLDEPTNGLDPNGQIEIQDCIRRLQEEGKTVLMSTHQLPEVTQVCSQVVILNRGQIHYQNSMDEALAARSHIRMRVNKPIGSFADELTAVHANIAVEEDIVYLRDDAMELRRDILVMLLKADFDVLRVEHQRISLSEIYSEAVQ